MFKRPAYISISVGFLSIYCAVMVLLYLRIVFISGAADDSAPAPTPPAATTEAPVVVPVDEVPIPKAAMPFIMLVYAIISFVCTVNMLEGANWARWLYTVSFLLMLICDILDYSDHIIPYLPALFIRGFVIPLLFLPGANEFFRQQN